MTTPLIRDTVKINSFGENNMDDYEPEDDPTCDDCRGTGEGLYDGASCTTCRGKGWLQYAEEHEE